MTRYTDSPRTARRRRRVLSLCVLVLAGGPATAGLSAGTGVGTGADVDPACESDGAGPALGTEWRFDPFEDTVTTESLEDWTGGRVVRVSVAGDCSLAVTRNETATLTATTVDGTRGLVTATLDLGSNGSLRFVPARGRTATNAGTAAVETRPVSTGAPALDRDTTRPTAGGPATADGTRTVGGDVPSVTDSTAGVTPLVVENGGPDFGTEVLVRRGDRSERVALASGRFFHARVGWTGDAVRVAVWNATRPWDGTWDARFAGGVAREGWRVRLGGRAFLDAIAVGVPAGESTGPTTQARGGTGAGDDGADVPGSGFDGRERRPDAGQGTPAVWNAFLGLLLVGGGAAGHRYAYEVTRFGEQLDAIGSTTRSSEVEPTDWNVMVTKLCSVAAVVVGLAVLVGALR